MQVPATTTTTIFRTYGFLLLLFLVLAVLPPSAVAQDEVQAFDPYPLRPANTSSPRGTLRSFDTSINEAIQAYKAHQPEAALQRAMRRAHDTFDFSQLPERGKVPKEMEAVLLMKEILDRIELPTDEAIPDDAEVKGQGLNQWTIPNTRITIAKVEEGPRAGEFLFSAETVRRLEEFYQDTQHLPYKPGGEVGLYEEYIHRPGRIVPRSWADAIPQWSQTVVLGEAVWQWLGFALVVTTTFLVVRGLLRWGRRWDGRVRSAGPFMRFGMPLGVLASVLALYGCRFVLLNVMRVLSDWWIVLSTIIWVLIFAGIGWLIFLLTARIADAVNNARHAKEGSIDGQLIQTVFRLLSLAVLVFLVLYAADFFGIPLTPVAASLGVGGLAIALAVRPTLENIIGGLTLFADKPVRIGNFCRFGDEVGTVEAIGLRSTRLRKLDDTLVSVPNADFSQRELTNFARRRCWLYETSLGLRYETTPEQLRYVMTKLREMLIGHPKVSPDSLHVRFHSFGAYSLDLKLFAYLRTRDWLDYLAIREDINLRVIDIVKEAGTGFAFPSQTAYLGRDSGLDVERGSQAEKAVQEWRSKGELPFPEFDEQLVSEKQDTLDFPPTGSPNYKPRTAV